MIELGVMIQILATNRLIKKKEGKLGSKKWLIPQRQFMIDNQLIQSLTITFDLMIKNSCAAPVNTQSTHYSPRLYLSSLTASQQLLQQKNTLRSNAQPPLNLQIGSNQYQHYLVEKDIDFGLDCESPQFGKHKDIYLPRQKKSFNFLVPINQTYFQQLPSIDSISMISSGSKQAEQQLSLQRESINLIQKNKPPRINLQSSQPPLELKEKGNNKKSGKDWNPESNTKQIQIKHLKQMKKSKSKQRKIFLSKKLKNINFKSQTSIALTHAITQRISKPANGLQVYKSQLKKLMKVSGLQSKGLKNITSSDPIKSLKAISSAKAINIVKLNKVKSPSRALAGTHQLAKPGPKWSEQKWRRKEEAIRKHSLSAKKQKSKSESRSKLTVSRSPSKGKIYTQAKHTKKRQ